MHVLQNVSAAQLLFRFALLAWTFCDTAADATFYVLDVISYSQTIWAILPRHCLFNKKKKKKEKDTKPHINTSFSRVLGGRLRLSVTIPIVDVSLCWQKWRETNKWYAEYGDNRLCLLKQGICWRIGCYCCDVQLWHILKLNFNTKITNGNQEVHLTSLHCYANEIHAGTFFIFICTLSHLITTFHTFFNYIR